MAKVNMMQLREDPPRRVFIPAYPYNPHCESGWNVELKPDEMACPACTEHRCVDEFYERWCRTCKSEGIVKISTLEEE